MNPTRLVSGVAALAIGFGVTLVGVNVADDPIDTVATVDVDDSSAGTPATDPVVDAPDRAEQDEEEALPPSDAQVEEPGPANSDDGSATGQPPTPRDTTSTTVVTTTSPAPSNDARCETVLVVTTTAGGTVILRLNRQEYVDVGGGEFEIPRSSGLDPDEIVEAVQIDGQVDDASVARRVRDCETGVVSVEREDGATSGNQTEDSGQSGGEVVGPTGERRAGLEFPCSDDAFAGLVATLSTQENADLTDDVDVFVRAVANRLAERGDLTVDEWDRAVSDEFDEFAVFDDGCDPEVDAALANGGEPGFFCAASRVSADSGLFEFLRQEVPELMVDCVDSGREGAN